MNFYYMRGLTLVELFKRLAGRDPLKGRDETHIFVGAIKRTHPNNCGQKKLMSLSETAIWHMSVKWMNKAQIYWKIKTVRKQG